VSTLVRVASAGESAGAAEFDASRKAQQSKKQSRLVNNPEVQKRLRGVTADLLQRNSPFPARQAIQAGRFQLPVLPTTTIGS